MQQRARRQRGRRDAGVPVRALLALVAIAAALAGCSREVVDGHAVSTRYDPFRVGGLPATDGPSGPREGAPAPSGTVEGGDGGGIDHLALLSVDDIEDYWSQHYRPDLRGRFAPVSALISYDSDDPRAPLVCGEHTYQLVNAGYCRRDDVIAWDRGVLLPVAKKFFGDMSITALLAHEYGHAIQQSAGLITRSTPVLVAEQQADCLAGVYLHWVAEGQSPRFTLSTGDGLNHVLAGAIAIRDPIATAEDADMLDQGHGTALDRVSAFQMGFDVGTTACIGIDMDEIRTRRGDLPMSLQVDPQGNPESGQVPIDQAVLTSLMERLGEIFSPAQPPTLSTTRSDCARGSRNDPAAYCPDTNTIAVDLAALQAMGAPATEEQLVLLQGDDTALSVLTSRYMLALQHQRGAALDSATAALRTACLTGVAQRAMAAPATAGSPGDLVLTAGDLDEAVAGLLTNGQVASDVNGVTVPAGFTRILAFRSGLLGDADQCYSRFA